VPALVTALAILSPVQGHAALPTRACNELSCRKPFQACVKTFEDQLRITKARCKVPRGAGDAEEDDADEEVAPRVCKRREKRLFNQRKKACRRGFKECKTCCRADQHACSIRHCGDDITVPGEQCDDGNVIAADGCSADCLSRDICSAPPEPTRCWTVTSAGGELVVLRISTQTGRWEEYGRYEAGLGTVFNTGGLARKGDAFVMAADTGKGLAWLKLDMSTGKLTRGRGGLRGWISANANFFVTLGTLNMALYPTFAALDAGHAFAVVGLEAPLAASRLGLYGDEAYTAWHSTDRVEVFDLESGAHLRTVRLEDYDTWVQGISIAGGALHLMDDGRGRYADQGLRIARFHPCTGRLIGDTFIERSQSFVHRLAGLWCEVE